MECIEIWLVVNFSLLGDLIAYSDWIRLLFVWFGSVKGCSSKETISTNSGKTLGSFTYPKTSEKVDCMPIVSVIEGKGCRGCIRLFIILWYNHLDPSFQKDCKHQRLVVSKLLGFAIPFQHLKRASTEDLWNTMHQGFSDISFWRLIRVTAK